MSNVKYIIGLRNTEPAPPEFVYFCGPKAPITTLSGCIDENETVWDEHPECAELFRSTPAVAEALAHLTALFGHTDLVIKKRTITYEFIDTELFLSLVHKNKVNGILHGMDEDDIKYLQETGILDLTAVT